MSAARRDEDSRSSGWPELPDPALPLVLADLDGTLRGDVLPMVRLVKPLLPRLADKALLREPWNAQKLAHFLWDVAKLWALRTLHAEERRRYKRLFSELHHLTAAMLRGIELEVVRAKYRDALPRLEGLWAPGAIEFLRRASAHSVVAIVTGSEQVQTEQCVALLSRFGVEARRVLAFGSLYRRTSDGARYAGGVEHLNVTLEAKRDVVQRVAATGRRVVAALGNSRPDRALFEAVEPRGLRVLVTTERVAARRRADRFVLRKLARSGFRFCWTGEEYLDALDALDRGGAPPILAVEPSFSGLLDCPSLGERYGEWMHERVDAAPPAALPASELHPAFT